ncbi:MAG: OFA family MFS transporter [Gammaproteobacteria bacterium]|nr:OFA family MFS transporter [Gammaproteobacteria bacterium]
MNPVRLSGIPFPVPRVVIAGACTVLHLCFGTIYAWSFFQVLLVRQLGWSFTDTAMAFGFAIFSLGVAAAWAGVQLPKVGPRRLAFLGSLLFSVGYLVGAFALSQDSLAMFYAGFSVIGGIGLGMGYVTPVATVANWFPDHKGLATGIVVMGFGVGALLLSKLLAPILLVQTDDDLTDVFMWLGLIFGAITIPMSLLVVNPPKQEAKVQDKDVTFSLAEEDDPDYVKNCVKSREFLVMWVIFFVNIVAGISVISFQSPLLQDIWKLTDPTIEPKVLATYGATLIAVSSVCNGVGRLFWGLLSDYVGRVLVFRILLSTQIVVFGILMTERDPWIFSILLCYVLLCFGGGFATIPSFISDVFGTKKMSSLYGFILTAWAMAGILGPLYVGYLKDSYPNKVVIYCFLIGVLVLSIGFVYSMLLNNDRIRIAKPTMASTLLEFNIPVPKANASTNAQMRS